MFYSGVRDSRESHREYTSLDRKARVAHCGPKATEERPGFEGGAGSFLLGEIRHRRAGQVTEGGLSQKSSTAGFRIAESGDHLPLQISLL